MGKGWTNVEIIPKSPITPPRQEDEQPPVAMLITRRTTISIVSGLMLIILTLAGYVLYLWRTASRAEQRATSMEQQISQMWNQVQDLERENQGLRQSTGKKIAALEEKMRELAGPRLNWPVYEVLSKKTLQRAGQAGRVNKIHLPADVSGFSLILNPGNRARFSDYRLEIVNAGGKIIWQGDGLRRNPLGAFNLTLTRALLSEDRYTVKVYGKNGPRLKLLDDYSLLIATVPKAGPEAPSAHRR